MCDQVMRTMEEEVEFGNQEEEEDYNFDYCFGSLSPIRCSSPGSRSWYANAWSELLEHPIPQNPDSTVLMNSVDISTCYPLPIEIANDGRNFKSQGSLSPIRCSTPGSRSWDAYTCERCISLTVAFISSDVFMNIVETTSRFLPQLRYVRFLVILEVLDDGNDYNSQLEGPFIEVLVHAPDCILNFSSLRMLETQLIHYLPDLCKRPVPDYLQKCFSWRKIGIELTSGVPDQHKLPVPDNLPNNISWSHLLMKGELHAYSLRNLMNTTIKHVFLQACSYRKSNHNDHSFVACECENKVFLAQATDCRENNCQFQSFIPCGSSSEFSPCRMASIVCFLYLFEESHEDFTVLGSIFDIRTSFCTSSFKFSYHSSPGNAHGHHYHGTLSLNLLVHSKKSSVGLFEIVYCPLKACFPSKDRGGPSPNKKKQSGLSPNPDSIMVRSSSNDRLMLLDSLQTFEHSANGGGKSHEAIEDTQTNNQHTRKESNIKWSAGGSISLQDIVKHYGKKKREEAAESLQVSVSTFKRLCRQYGISRWPSTKGKRDKSFLFTRKSIASFQVADGEYASASQSQKAFLSDLQPFSASSTAIETHQESSLFSIQSNHSQGDQLHNHNMLGNIKTTKGKNMPRGRALTYKSRQYKARKGSLSIENLMPDSLERTSRPPQNYMPCDGDSGTSSTSSHKRKRLEKETDCIEKVTHFEEQSSQMQNCVPKRQAVDSASKDSSCLSSIIGTIEGNNMGYIPNSITGHDVVDSTHMGVQPSLESISTHPLNSFSCNENTAQNTKLLFNNLIALPLKDLINPENETSMRKALSILEHNLSLFSEEQAEQILELSFDFPTLVHSWRKFSQSQMDNQKFLDETEKIRYLVETSVKDEESLKVRYEELESKEKELMAQLEAVQKEKAVVAEQRNENSRKTKHFVSLAEEKAAGRTKEKHMMKIATTKLNNLVDQWAKIQSFFIEIC